MAAMKTTSIAARAPAVSPRTQRVAAAASPGVRQSSNKKRRRRELDAPTPTATRPPSRVKSSTPAAAGGAPTAAGSVIAAGTPPPAKKARSFVRRGSTVQVVARPAGVTATAAATPGAVVEGVPGGGERVAKPRGRGGKRHQVAKERRAAAQARDAAASAAAAARRRAGGGGDDLADNLDLPKPGAAAPAATREEKLKARKEAKKANPSPGRVARAAVHAAERAVADAPLYSDPAEFLRAAHKRWARDKLPGSEPPTKEVVAVGRLPADRVAGVPAPVALADVAAIIDVRYPAMRAVQKARHRAAAKVPPTAAAVKLLVLTQSAVKCTEFGRLLRPLTAAGADPPPPVAKLFSKHIKLEESVAVLKAAAASSLGHVPLAVGTPSRVLALLEAGTLVLLRSTLVVVDVSRDVKQRMVVDGTDTANEFMCMLGRHLVPSGCSLFLFRDRGVEVEERAAAETGKKVQKK
ncbi:hypothetical protein MMPV_004751 [Pyropia vietnamensis]